jgi:hypothetical protein
MHQCTSQHRKFACIDDLQAFNHPPASRPFLGITLMTGAVGLLAACLAPSFDAGTAPCAAGVAACALTTLLHF